MKLNVYLTLTDGQQVLVGTLDFGDVLPGGRYETRFSYVKKWLDHPEFFPLDPESLDPQTGVAPNTFKSKQGLDVPLMVFMDALPDDWGQRLLIARMRFKGAMREPPYLLKAMGSSSLGALSFFETGAKATPKSDVSEHVVDLDALIAAAERFEAGDRDMDPEMIRLFSAGSSPGGARPKVLAYSDQTQWIAKLPSKSKDNGVDVVGLEGACMRLALSAGLDAARIEVKAFPRGNVLLVERFDVTGKGNGRNHMISLKTLCKERAGAFVQTYAELMGRIRAHSVQPEFDVERFYRQMVFNAVIGNTDDHLKNFAMIRDAEGYKLSKAFDLVPDVNGSCHHVLLFEYNPFTNGKELVRVGKQWDVRNPDHIVKNVCDAAMAFRAISVELNVTAGSLDRFASEIEARAAQFMADIALSRQASPNLPTD